jgi:replicative DNA helicase
MTNEQQITTPTIPHSREAEEAVLGAVLINSDAYFDVAHFLHADDFYIHRNGWIWEAFAHLQEKHVPLDLLTITEELDRKNQLAEIGGPAYLTALINQTPNSLNAESYGHIVSEHAARRRMIQAANQIAALAFNEQSDIEAVTSEAIQALESAVVRSTGDTLQPLSKSLTDVYEFVDQSSRTTELPGVPSGIHDLDVLLGNFQKGEVSILAARPGQGKTSLELSILNNAAQSGKRSAFFSLEMSREKVTSRLIAQHSGLNVQLLNTGKLSDEQWPVFTAGIEHLAKLPIFIDDTPAISPSQILTRCRKLIMTSGPLDLVAIDYLQLMKSGGKAENRTQEIGLISRALKVLAKELNIPVLAAAQLNRDLEKRADKLPQLSDLRESGDIEADADVVIFLHQPDPEQKSSDTVRTDLIVAKHRNGPVGTISTRFIKTVTRFESMRK